MTSIVRTYPARLEVGRDRRTVEGVAVPYDEPATVSDGGTPYQEVWRRGAFRRIVRAPHRVTFTWEHAPGLMNTLGRAVHLEERPDGLFGTFRVVDSDVGRHALALVEEDLDQTEPTFGLSISAIPLGKFERNAAGVVERKLAHLEHVTMTRQRAYQGARITALRSADGAWTDTPLRDEAAAILARMRRAR